MSNLNMYSNDNRGQEESTNRRECRYCLSDEKLEKLIDPCKCEGTMKYVHQECLQEWIKNGNKQVYISSNHKKQKIYSTICEICKFQMKYTKKYKYNVFMSIIKLMKSILTNSKNCFILVIHSSIIYFLIKRLRLFYYESLRLLKKSFILFNPSYLIGLTHNITVLISILIGINDIYMFYSKLLKEKRKCLINFLPKSMLKEMA